MSAMPRDGVHHDIRCKPFHRSFGLHHFPHNMSCMGYNIINRICSKINVLFEIPTQNASKHQRLEGWENDNRTNLLSTGHCWGFHRFAKSLLRFKSYYYTVVTETFIISYKVPSPNWLSSLSLWPPSRAIIS